MGTGIARIAIKQDMEVMMAQNSTADRQLDQTANGQEVRVPVGETLRLELPETRTAGYRWTIVSNGAPVTELVEDDFEPPSDTPGRAGSHRWTFRVLQPGHSSIELRYARSWELSAESYETFTLALTSV